RTVGGIRAGFVIGFHLNGSYGAIINAELVERAVIIGIRPLRAPDVIIIRMADRSRSGGEIPHETDQGSVVIQRTSLRHRVNGEDQMMIHSGCWLWSGHRGSRIYIRSE